MDIIFNNTPVYTGLYHYTIEDIVLYFVESKDFIIRYNDSYSQVNSELTCETQSLHLISKGTYGFCEQNRNTPEFWTGIKRFRYNDTGRLTGN